MACMCSERDEIILSLFKQIDDSILLLMQWNQEVNGADDYLLSPLRPEIKSRQITVIP